MSKENKAGLDTGKVTASKKKIIKRVILILVILFVGFIVISILPFLFFVGVIKWIGILSVVFVVIGYIMFGIDKILKKNNLSDKSK